MRSISKFLISALIVLASAMPAFAQAPTLFSWRDTLTNSIGQSIPGATVIILEGTVGGSEAVNTTTRPGSPLATIYSDPYGATPIDQTLHPLTTARRDGGFQFWAAAGYYVIQAYGPGINGSLVYGTSVAGGGSSSSGVTSVAIGNLSPLFTTVVSNPTTTPSAVYTLSDADAFTVFGNCTDATAAPSYCSITTDMLPSGIIKGSISATQVAVGTDVDTIGGYNGLLYDNDTGVLRVNVSGVRNAIWFRDAATSRHVGWASPDTVNANQVIDMPATLPTSFGEFLGHDTNVVTGEVGTSWDEALTDNNDFLTYTGTHGFTVGQVNLVDKAAPAAIVSRTIIWSDSSHWPDFNANNTGTRSMCGSTGSFTSGHIVAANATGTKCDLVDGGTGTGSGTVTNFSANDITTASQTFATAGVTSPGVTPDLTFTLANAPAHKYFGNDTGSSAAPDYESIVAADLPATTVNSVVNDTNVTGSISGQALTLAWTSTLAVSRGGSGAGTFSAHGVLLGEGTSAFVPKVAGANAQCFMSAPSSFATTDPSFQTCPSGVTIQTNTVANSSQAVLNFTTTSGSTGIAASNPSGGVQSFAIANPSGSGNSVFVGTLTGPAQFDYICENASTALVNCVQGVTVNAQTGTSYTIQSSDRGKFITFSNALAIAVTVPQSGTTGFANGFYFTAKNLGAGLVTFTPTTSTVNGGATTTLATSVGASWFSDNTNYFTK